jgi:hypothetical protein
MKITQDDLLDALRWALTSTEGEVGMTGPELADAMGCTQAKARDALRRLAGEGRLAIVTLKRQALDGRTMTIKGYRLLAKARQAA